MALVARVLGSPGAMPGPGSYDTPKLSAYKPRSPEFTLKSRHETNSEIIAAPYQDVGSTIGQGPKITMSSRHKMKEFEDTPGPNYVPPPLGADAPKATITSRHSETRDSRLDNPGPGAYNIQPKFANDANKFTMHSRTNTGEVDSCSPGPGAYMPNIDAVKKRAPSASMHIRPKDQDISVTPGPSDYVVSRDLGGKSSTIGCKTKDRDISVTPGPADYSPNDNKPKSPQFTMKGRHETKQEVIAAPYRDIGSTIGQGPKITMSSRHKMKEFEDTPGPNYVPPPLGADAPKATITSRHSETRDSRLDNPGPGAYNIQPKFANDANKFTMHSRTNTGEVDSCSPGPGAYMPNIDAVKKRAPSASMHIRPKDQDISVTPGPSDYVVSRDLGGKSSTIGCKTKDRDISVTPGPADYSPNDNKPKSPQFTMKGRHETKQEVIAAPYRDIGSTIGQGPKITMSSRHKMKEFEDTPGPNYVPPPLGADAPKATITSRHSETRDSRLDNPGPGAYNIQPKFANDANKFTMHSRTNTGEVDSCSPGPGAYMPNIDAVKKRAPSASMHIRPKDQDISVTPGPSDYVVSRDLGGKSSTIGCKTKDRDISVTPGPADYSPNDNKPKSPQFTMKGRHETKQEVIAAPYRDIGSTIGQGPKITMSSRHKMKEFEDTPGPNYVPPPLGADAPKATITSRHSETRDSRLDNPGPGAYNIQPKFANDANKFTMHSRTNTGEVDSCSPGPGAYMPNIDAVKKRAPSASMHIRPKDQDISVTPGPSDYVVSRDLGGKSSTIGCKTKDRDISVTPGPADYSPNDNKPKSPQFTMKGRHETKQEVIAAPYRDIGSTIGQGPKITMSSRHKMKEFEDTPGPNYVPPPLGADAPKATITSRHSETRDSRLDNPGPGAYNIQPKFANDANKFTMHSRTNTGEVDSCSPGPGAYMPNIDAVKKRAPSASMHIRPKDQDISVTPGPSDYVVSRDLGGKSSTIGCKTKDRDISVTPGPADYSPNDNKPKSPQFTMKGRHETKQEVIAAPYRDIGSTIGQGPKITMSSRHKMKEFEDTPGPNYVPPPLGADAPKATITSRHSETRDSRLDNPGPGAYNIQPKFANDANKFTMHSRTNTGEVDSCSPGPGAYMPNIDAVKKRAPSASMHIRPKDQDISVTPGPSDYVVSRDLGGKSSTIGCKTKDRDISVTPGPADYSPNDNKPKSPQFTMKGRHETKQEVIAAPYRDIGSTIGQGPKITMSSRHKMKEFEDTPGPNYVPPPLGADAPKATITSRHSETRDSRLDNPGPGAYNIQPKFANDANKFTMHSRTNTGEVDSCSPGPGAYMPNIDAVKKRAPSASMHIRPKDQDISVTPGPSDYVVSRDLGGKSSTIGCKTKDRDISVTPGPADYSPNDNKPKSPQFTMKGRHETKQEVIAAPYRDIGSTIGQGPKITMSSRHKMKEFEDTPGPNYVPPPLGADAPKATITSRHSETRDSRLDNPGPGAYNIQPKFANDANKFTMHSRTNTGEVDSCSPGPGAYMPNIDAVKKRAPSASMHIRPKDKGSEETPGYVALPSTLQGPYWTIKGRENLDLIPV